MNMTFDLIIGIFLVSIGLLTLLGRLMGWNWMFSKRDAAKARFGNRAGDILHFISYTVLPIVFGLLFILIELVR